jgi:hypothetical protein
VRHNHFLTKKMLLKALEVRQVTIEWLLLLLPLATNSVCQRSQWDDLPATPFTFETEEKCTVVPAFEAATLALRASGSSWWSRCY